MLSRKKLAFVFFAVAVLATASAEARYVYSGDKCNHRLPFYNRPGVCGDRRIPKGRNRNARNIVLVCSSSSDHHLRGPNEMPPEKYKQWQKAEEKSRTSASPKKKRENMLKAHELKRSEPIIEWDGVIPYQTVETWDWTECIEGQNGFECGYHTDTETYTETEYYTDSNGNSRSRTVTKTRTVQHANHCKYDVTRSEAVHCSTEQMKFHLEYAKPPKSWKPPITDAELLAEGKKEVHLRYHPLIDNMYDLLPGEIEDVQVLTNEKQSSTLRPTVVVGDAWNIYEHDIRFARGGSSAKCKYDTDYSIDVVMRTIRRDNTKATPNAFRVPKGQDPFKYFTSPDPDTGKSVNTRPSNILLEDVSNGVLEVMTKQIRSQSAAIEEAKKEAGLGSRGAIDNPEEADELGFFKNTKLRVAMMEMHTLFGWDAGARDRRRAKTLYGGGVMMTIDGDFWNVRIGEEPHKLYKGAGNFGSRWLFNSFEIQLVPDTKYLFHLSMYQDGIPFYAQKNMDGSFWKELWHGENAYYSRPLILEFDSPSIDMRDFMNKAADW